MTQTNLPTTMNEIKDLYMKVIQDF